MMEQVQPTKLTVTHHGTVVSAELAWDASMDDILLALDGLLIAQGWPKNSLDNWARRHSDQLDRRAAKQKK